MSYSFSVRAASKAAVMVEIAAKMAEVAVAQKCHARDMVPAIQAASAFVDQLADDATRDYAVAMSGSLVGRWDGSDVVYCEGAAVSVNAHLVPRVPQAA